MASPHKPHDLKFDTVNPQWKDKSTVGGGCTRTQACKQNKNKQGLSLQNTVGYYHLIQFRLHMFP